MKMFRAAVFGHCLKGATSCFGDFPGKMWQFSVDWRQRMKYGHCRWRWVSLRMTSSVSNMTARRSLSSKIHIKGDFSPAALSPTWTSSSKTSSWMILGRTGAFTRRSTARRKKVRLARGRALCSWWSQVNMLLNPLSLLVSLKCKQQTNGPETKCLHPGYLQKCIRSVLSLLRTNSLWWLPSLQLCFSAS